MTGGNVVYSTTVDVVDVVGRVSSAGAKVAPASGAGKWSSAKSSTGVYTITFTEQYPEYMGCQLTLEAASGIIEFTSFSARVLTISTFNVDGTTAADKAFSFRASFSENKAP